MKKILSIALGVVLTLGAIALTSSCKKDITNAESLVGTEWVCTDVEGTFHLTFPSASEFRVVLEGSNWVAPGFFIITGNKASLTGSHITLTLSPGCTWIDGETAPIIGKFESESSIYFGDDDMTFRRALTNAK